MRRLDRPKISGRTAVLTGAVLLGIATCAAPATAAPAVHAASAAQTGGVSPTAALGTPQLNKTGKHILSVVRQLVQCGSTMYAVGRFTSINQGSTNYARSNIFSFSAASPYTVTSWAPDINGQVNSIAFSGPDCSDAYIGGKFTSVNGTAVDNIAEIDTTTGNVVPGFGTHANFEVWTIVPVNGHLLVGGSFTYINGSHNPYLASVSPVTGDDDNFVHLKISGDYHYCAAGGSPCTSNTNHTEIYNQQLSHGGTLDLLEGHFTSVGGLPRQQIFMLSLAGSKATVAGWTSPEWDGSDPSAYPYYQCWPDDAFYIRSAAWSPDDATIYIATTGTLPAQNPADGYTERTGLCDAVAAFPSTQGPVNHIWVEYSGCDSYYSVAADSAAVYAAGHPRWADNPQGCNLAGAGATTDYGIQGLNPGNGVPELNSRSTAKYTMTRANGDDMMITSAGLWIASTNRYTVNKCGDMQGPPGHNSADHAGICFMPYR